MTNKKQLFIIIIIFFLLLSKSNFSYSSTHLNSVDSLKDTIIALNVTQKKSEQELDKLYRLQQSLTNDIYEYTIFIEYLAYQIKTYCQQLKEQFGSKSLSGLPCNIRNNYLRSNSKDKKIKTSEEQLSSMEDELMNSLGDFDEMLLKEEEILAQINKNKDSNSLSNSSKEQDGEEKLKGNGGKEHSEEISQDGKQRSKDDNAQRNVKGKQKNSSGKQINERRRLDEIDDDIVARQLKEAAEKETDPRLKEKLWDEYYNYKKGN